MKKYHLICLLLFSFCFAASSSNNTNQTDKKTVAEVKSYNDTTNVMYITGRKRRGRYKEDYFISSYKVDSYSGDLSIINTQPVLKYHSPDKISAVDFGPKSRYIYVSNTYEPISKYKVDRLGQLSPPEKMVGTPDAFDMQIVDNPNGGNPLALVIDRDHKDGGRLVQYNIENDGTFSNMIYAEAKLVKDDHLIDPPRKIMELSRGVYLVLNHVSISVYKHSTDGKKLINEANLRLTLDAVDANYGGVKGLQIVKSPIWPDMFYVLQPGRISLYSLKQSPYTLTRKASYQIMERGDASMEVTGDHSLAITGFGYNTIETFDISGNERMGYSIKPVSSVTTPHPGDLEFVIAPDSGLQNLYVTNWTENTVTRINNNKTYPAGDALGENPEIIKFVPWKRNIKDIIYVANRDNKTISSFEVSGNYFSQPLNYINTENTGNFLTQIATANFGGGIRYVLATTYLDRLVSIYEVNENGGLLYHHSVEFPKNNPRDIIIYKHTYADRIGMKQMGGIILGSDGSFPFTIDDEGNFNLGDEASLNSNIPINIQQLDPQTFLLLDDTSKLNVIYDSMDQAGKFHPSNLSQFKLGNQDDKPIEIATSPWDDKRFLLLTDNTIYQYSLTKSTAGKYSVKLISNFKFPVPMDSHIKFINKNTFVVTTASSNLVVYFTIKDSGGITHLDEKPTPYPMGVDVGVIDELASIFITNSTTNSISRIERGTVYPTNNATLQKPTTIKFAHWQD